MTSDRNKNTHDKDDKDDQGNYHHGNLRLALLDAAIAQIKEVGVEKLSLRGIARSVGVSQTAPYRHFKDKNELLAEIATQAFLDLYTATSKHIRDDQSPCDNIKVTWSTYLAFAINNPEKYKLMFGSSILNRTDYPNMVSAGDQSLNVLITQVERGIAEGIFLKGCPMVLANTLWTQAHGMASLIIDGFYDNREIPMPFDEFLNIQISIASRAIQIKPEPFSLDKIDH
ncbi:MAG: AcrR family transcriptional regulator [Oleispira sp.]|jgi:AcrR family transcriptional regulator